MKNISFILLGLLLSTPIHHLYAQRKDSLATPVYFNGSIAITNKGISTVPNLTLGKPAAIFDLALGRKRLSFEPQLRFALEGKPWTFIFWWRYQLIKTSKWQGSVGAHPAIAFKTKTVTLNGNTSEELIANRYLAGEITQNYFLVKNFSLGIYYLYSHALEKNIIRNTNYLAFRLGFTHIPLGKKIFLRFNPQVYYLNLDKQDGYYFNTTLALVKNEFPLSITCLINKEIHSNISVGEDFLWNVSLTYSFRNTYQKVKS